MASWREIERFRKDPAACKALAGALLRAHLPDLTDWEASFLRGIALNVSGSEYTTRQAEKLLQIRDDAETVTTLHGFNLGTLLTKCHQARLDLSDADEAWIVAQIARRAAGFKRRDAIRLLRLSRQLGLVESEFA